MLKPHCFCRTLQQLNHSSLLGSQHLDVTITCSLNANDGRRKIDVRVWPSNGAYSGHRLASCDQGSARPYYIFVQLGTVHRNSRAFDSTNVQRGNARSRCSKAIQRSFKLLPILFEFFVSLDAFCISDILAAKIDRTKKANSCGSTLYRPSQTVVIFEECKAFLQQNETLTGDLPFRNLSLCLDLPLHRPPSNHRRHKSNSGCDDVTCKANPIGWTNIIFENIGHPDNQENRQRSRQQYDHDRRETRQIVFFHQTKLQRVRPLVERVAA